MRIVAVGTLSALVDDGDYELVSRFKWRPYRGGRSGKNGTNYAMAHSPMVDGERHSIIMHRIIMDASKGTGVDHVDGNGLNNQRSNLRLVTAAENGANQKSREGCSSKFKGVSLDKRHGTWKSYIQVRGKIMWLGQYRSEADAAKAYDAAARKYFGQYARLNFNEVQP
jgi:hypothetical protein